MNVLVQLGIRGAVIATASIMALYAGNKIFPQSDPKDRGDPTIAITPIGPYFYVPDLVWLIIGASIGKEKPRA